VARSLLAAAALSTLLLAGCKKDIQNQDAVRQGVMSYLSKRSDLLAMDVNVTSVSFRQDEATAVVHFQAKGNPSPAAGMTMQYVLERKGADWVVKGRTGSNSGHGGAGMPTGPAPADPSSSQSGPGPRDGMPRITSPGGSGSSSLQPGSLPPGHPAVGSPQQ
jgi:outer membrane murein-binding lipoprotein Lpp